MTIKYDYSEILKEVFEPINDAIQEMFPNQVKPPSPSLCHAFLDEKGHQYYQNFYSIYAQPNGNLIFITNLTSNLHQTPNMPGTYVGVVKGKGLLSTQNISTHPYVQLLDLLKKGTYSYDKTFTKDIKTALKEYQEFNPNYQKLLNH